MNLVAAVADALDADVRSTTRVTGGDVADAHRFELTDGRAIFVKTHRAPPAGFFTTEAAGLSWLADTAAVPVPDVLAVSDGDEQRPPFLALEWIDTAPVRSSDEGEFGRSLARLHRAGAPQFGRSDRRTTGSRALPNEPCPTWAEFYATQRLGPLVQLARDSDALPVSTLRQIDRIAGNLGAVGGPVEPAARLHGDLWAGNRLVDTSGISWLIDPAAHGGHREFDLAMMRLFGGFGPECFAAYEAEAPLADGWRERVPLHQLAPLIVHAVKFGGGYVGATGAAVRSIRSDLT